MNVQPFGTMPDGQAVERIIIKGGGLTANILTYGAILQDLRLEGHGPALVLGYDDFSAYLSDTTYFGAIAGRFANRIRDGHLEIDGKTYQIDKNFLGKHSLHGGAKGTANKVWCIEEAKEDRVLLAIDLPDGDMGFPGNITLNVLFSVLENGIFDLKMSARTDAPTLCNLAHHSYFNLDGSDSILDHELQLNAEHFLPVDEELIPTGEIRPVAGTRFDFRSGKKFRDTCLAGTLDHNLCLGSAQEALRPVGRLSSETSSIDMEIVSTEPGIQIYDGTYIPKGLVGLDKCVMGANAGCAIEPQIWPDANHHTNFPQALLKPGEVYSQNTQFIFKKSRI